jgi:hypothetical protein
MERYDEYDDDNSFWEANAPPRGRLLTPSSSPPAHLLQHTGEDGGASESGLPLASAEAVAPLQAVSWLQAIAPLPAVVPVLAVAPLQAVAHR